MNLELLYPHQQEGFDLTNLKALPNKHNEPSGYYMIAFIRSYMSTGQGRSTTVDRYLCFTNEERDNVWIEKLSIFRPRNYLVFDDTIKIEDDEEWNEVLTFLKKRKILE
jgi:hypothetical protein